MISITAEGGPHPARDWDAMNQDEKARIERKLDEMLDMLRRRNASASMAPAAPEVAATVCRHDTTAVALAPAYGGPTSTPDSTATSGASPVVPDARLVCAIDTTSLAAPLPTRCSTEGPSCGTIESRPAFAPATAPTSPTATVDVVPKLVATAASVIGDAASLCATCSSECPSSDASALVAALIPYATTQSMTLEAVPLTATTPQDVIATEQLKPFIVIDLSVLAPSLYSAECLINGVVDNTKLDDGVSLERVYVDPGDHRQPPWPPPCENSSLHKLQEILGQAAHLNSQHCNSKGPRGTISSALVSRMLQLHGNLLAPHCFLMFKGQFNASVKWCCKNLLWSVKEWGMDIRWRLQAGLISDAPTCHEQPASHILLQPFLLAHDAKPPWLLRGHEIATLHGHRTPVLVGALHVSRDKSVVVFRTLHLPPVCFSIAKDQSKASTKCCCNDLLLRVTDPFVSEYQVTSIPMEMMVRSSELNSFLSSPAPSFVVKIYSDGETASAYLNLDADGTYFLCMTTHRKSDIFGWLQLVSKALSYGTSKNNQAYYAAPLTCSLGISCLGIGGCVDLLFTCTAAVYSEYGNRFRQAFSVDILPGQYHWQIAWPSQFLELYPAAVLTLGAVACYLHKRRLVTAQRKIVWPLHQFSSANGCEPKEFDITLPELVTLLTVDWDVARFVDPQVSQLSLVFNGPHGPAYKMASEMQKVLLQDKETLDSSELTEGVLYMSMMGAVKIWEGDLLLVHKYWPDNFGCLQWEPGDIFNASTEMGWGQAETPASWESTYGVQLGMCFHIWKAASPRTAGKRYGQVSLVDVIRLMIYPVPVRGLGLDFDKLQTTWDPGGILLVHRLEGKPIFKKGGMLRTCLLPMTRRGHRPARRREGGQPENAREPSDTRDPNGRREALQVSRCHWLEWCGDYLGLRAVSFSLRFWKPRLKRTLTPIPFLSVPQPPASKSSLLL